MSALSDNSRLGTSILPCRTWCSRDGNSCLAPCGCSNLLEYTGTLSCEWCWEHRHLLEAPVNQRTSYLWWSWLARWFTLNRATLVQWKPVPLSSFRDPFWYEIHARLYLVTVVQSSYQHPDPSELIRVDVFLFADASFMLSTTSSATTWWFEQPTTSSCHHRPTLSFKSCFLRMWAYLFVDLFVFFLLIWRLISIYLRFILINIETTL